MIFSQVEFAIFLLVMLVAACVLKNRPRKLVLLVGSYYFYAYWDWRFCGLLLLSTVIDYNVGTVLARTMDPNRRWRLLLISLICNLGLLATFKYLNFFIDTLAPLLTSFGLQTSTLHIVLPVGISFYTFQTLSYTIDIYNRQLEPCQGITDFALFVAFFPQLVAGPIVRAATFLPQLDSAPKVTAGRILRGSRQFIVGLFKKVVIADSLALFVDQVFGNAGLYDGVTTWVAVIAYAMQIYCDFSGYSDMAIGVAHMLGYDFPINFDYPYISRSITEFWRRWHISLSSWLRDYLYIPLGGNRRGTRRTYINLMATMLLGGLWHGAAWTFVFWGLIHGGALAANRALPLTVRGRVSGAVGWFVTMIVVLVGWVFFRSTEWGFAQASTVLSRMFVHPSEGIRWLPPFIIACGLLAMAAHAMHATRFRHWRDLPEDRWTTATVLGLMVWLLAVLPPGEFAPFIYFQF